MGLPSQAGGLERVERLHKLILAAVVGGSLAIITVLLMLYATTGERGVLVGALIIGALLPFDILIIRTLLRQRLQDARALLEALTRATGGPATVASVGGRILVASRSSEGTLMVAAMTGTGETLLIRAKPGAIPSTFPHRGGRLQLLGLERLAMRGEERLLYGCRVKSARLRQPIVLPDPLQSQATVGEATVHLISCPGGDRQALYTVLEALAREDTY